MYSSSRAHPLSYSTPALERRISSGSSAADSQLSSSNGSSRQHSSHSIGHSPSPPPSLPMHSQHTAPSAAAALPPAIPALSSFTELSASLSALFQTVSALSEEKIKLHASYMEARARRKAVQAKLSAGEKIESVEEQSAADASATAAATAASPEQPPHAPSAAAAPMPVPVACSSSTSGTASSDTGNGRRNTAPAINVQGLDPPSFAPPASAAASASAAAATSLAVAVPASSSRSGRDRSSAASGTAGSIEQHSARLRSASLERQRQREAKSVFPRTMLSTQHPPLAATGTPLAVITTPMAAEDRRGSGALTPDAGPGSPAMSASPSPSSADAVASLSSDPSLLQATQELFAQLRAPGPSGLRVSDHRVRFKTYPACSSGAEIVEWMVRKGWSTDKDDARCMVQALVDQGVVVSVHATQASASTAAAVAAATSGAHSSASSGGTGASLHKFDDTDEHSLYRLRDPLAAMASSASSSSTAAQAAAAAAAAPALACAWQFTPLVTQCSIALLPSLAHKIEAYSAAIAASAATVASAAASSAASSAASADSMPAPPLPPPRLQSDGTPAAPVSSLPALSSTPMLAQLRSNILYLCHKQKSIWKREPNLGTHSPNPAAAAAGGKSQQSQPGEVETYSMEKTFQTPAPSAIAAAAAAAPPSTPTAKPAAASSATSAASSLPPFPYTSLIQKSVGVLPSATTPANLLHELLDLKLRRRWEPLLVSARVVQQLDASVRVLHLLTNMQPLSKKLRQREALVFQDWFVDHSGEGSNGGGGSGGSAHGPTYILYELSVSHSNVPHLVPGYRRAEVLLNARIIAPLPPLPGSQRARTQLTIISQLDFGFDATETKAIRKAISSAGSSRKHSTQAGSSGAAANANAGSGGWAALWGSSVSSSPSSAASSVPAWFLEKWLGLPTSISLGMPLDKQGVTVLAHSPGDNSSHLAAATAGTAAAAPGAGTSPEAVYALSPLRPSASSLAEADFAGVPSSAAAASSILDEGVDSVLGPSSTSPPALPLPPLPTDAAVAMEGTDGVDVPSDAIAPASNLPAGALETAAAAAPEGIPEFHPLAVLGRGAYSKILLVRDAASGALYAMKVLRKSDVVSVGHEGHVLAEQSILAGLNHPFVCRLFHAFQSRSKLYMVMTYAAGGDMWTLLRRQKLSESLCAFYIAELVLALRHVHAAAVCHRDVKPENILIDAAGHIVLADFGLSHERMHSPQTRSYSVSGTSEYLSPEAIHSSRGHGQPMDWWQVGIILHEMLTGGRHPFFHKNLFRMQQNILHKQPNLAETISAPARSLIAGLLTKDPSQRLGNDVAGRDIESHPFFAPYTAVWGERWERLEARAVDPGFKPPLATATDVSNFDAMYTSEMAGGGGGGGTGAPGVGSAATPDSVFSHLGSGGLLGAAAASGSEFESNFAPLNEGGEGGGNAGEEELEEDMELQQLMAAQHLQQQQRSQQQGQTINHPHAPGAPHPNAHHAYNADSAPFSSHHPSLGLGHAYASHSSSGSNLMHSGLLYNSSPHFGSAPSPAPAHGAITPLPSAAPPLMPALPSSFAALGFGAGRTNDQDEPPPPMPAAQAPSPALGGGMQLDAEYFAQQSSQQHQQLGSFSSSGLPSPAAVSNPGSMLPLAGLFLRSQSLPNHSAPFDEHNSGGAVGGSQHFPRVSSAISPASGSGSGSGSEFGSSLGSSGLGGGGGGGMMMSPHSSRSSPGLPPNHPPPSAQQPHAAGGSTSGGAGGGSAPSLSLSGLGALPPPRLNYLPPQPPPAHLFGGAGFVPGAAVSGGIGISGGHQRGASGPYASIGSSGGGGSGSSSHSIYRHSSSGSTGSGSGDGAVYPNSSSSLPNSFHPHGHQQLHRSSLNQQQTHQQSSGAYSQQHQQSGYATVHSPFPGNTSSGSHLQIGHGGSMHGGGGGGGGSGGGSVGSVSRTISSSNSSNGDGGSMQSQSQQQQQQHPLQPSYAALPGGYPSHSGPASSGDAYDEIEAQYLEPEDAAPPPPPVQQSQPGSSAAQRLHPSSLAPLSMPSDSGAHSINYAYSMHASLGHQPSGGGLGSGGGGGYNEASRYHYPTVAAPSHGRPSSTPTSPSAPQKMRVAQQRQQQQQQQGPWQQQAQQPQTNSSHGTLQFGSSGPRSPSSRLHRSHAQLQQQQHQDQE